LLRPKAPTARRPPLGGRFPFHPTHARPASCSSIRHDRRPRRGGAGRDRRPMITHGAPDERRRGTAGPPPGASDRAADAL
jgi:hypothetical protein